MSRKRHADTELKQGDSESEASGDEQGTGTWTPASEDEIAQREVVKVNRKRRMAVTNPESFPVFDFASKAGASTTPAPEQVAPEPSSAAPAAQEDNNPLLKFMPKVGSWNCEVCLVNNDAAKSKCAACDAAKPGAKAATSSPQKPALNANAAEFKFGGDSTSTTTTFKFGVAPGESTTTFKFGASVPALGSGSTTTPFKFGGSEGDQPASFSALSGEGAGASFSFLSSGSVSNATTSNSFQFGSKALEQETPAKEPLPEPVESGEENDQIVLKVPIVAYNLKIIDKEVDGKSEKKQQWLECGNGDLHVNTYQGEDGETRSRLVLRMAKTHRLALNVPLFKNMSLERSHDKMLRLTSVSTEDPQQFESYLLKTKSKEEADSLFKTLTDLTV